MGKKNKNTNQLNISNSSKKKRIFSEAFDEDENCEDQNIKKENENVATENKIDVPKFNYNEMNCLLKNVLKQIPPKDNLKFITRLDKLDWDKITFEQFTIEDCKKILAHAFNCVRKYRTLEEVLTDAIASASKPASKIYKIHKQAQQKPKHPISSYLIYASEIREKLRKQNPQMSIVEIGKLTGEKWRNLSDSKKEKYIKKFNENRKNYFEEVSKLKEKKGPEEKKEKRENLYDKPKTPLSMYVSEKLNKDNPELEGLNNKEIYNYYRSKYNELSDKKKYKFIKKCLEAEEIYIEKLKEKFENKNDVVYKSILTKGERELYETMNGKPQAPPTNGYNLFCKEIGSNAEMASILSKDRPQAFSTKWKLLSEDERKSFNLRAKSLQDEFLTEMKAYIKKLPESEAFKLLINNPGNIEKKLIMEMFEQAKVK